MITITDSLQTIQKRINQAFAEEINKVLKKHQDSILSQAKELAVGWISKSDTLLSLASSDINSLKGNFGIPTGQDVIATADIVNAVSSSTNVTFKGYNKQLRGVGLEINFQPNDFVNLLGLASGHVVYEGGDLHWLKWLLLEGDRTIVAGYFYDPSTGLGRSGLGTMSTGGVFKVPSEHSGTADNNFITKALVGPDQEKAILNIIKSTLG
tara:strand:- start:7320 stop:7949 length:630 start_codon:yes stop_codon:yes gene_type:complete